MGGVNADVTWRSEPKSQIKSRVTKCVETAKKNEQVKSQSATVTMFHQLTHRTLFVCHGRERSRPQPLNASDNGALAVG